MINSDAQMRTPGAPAPAHQQAPDTTNVISRFAPPEQKVDFTLPNGQVTTMRFINWKPSKIFSRIPLYGSVLAVPMSMASNEDIDTNERIAQALSVLFSGLSQIDPVELMQGLLDEVYTLSGENVAEHFDAVFMAQPQLVLQLAAKVLEINYGPFLEIDLKGLFSNLKLTTQLSQ